MKHLLTICVLLLTSPVVGADAYKWTDAEGNVHYGDRPPADQATDVVGTAIDPTNKSTGPAPGATTPAPPPQASGEAVATTADRDASEITTECGMLKSKLEKYKKGLIDFSYESATGRKITPARTKVIEAYENAIDEACG